MSRAALLFNLQEAAMQHGFDAEVDGDRVTIAIPVLCPDRSVRYEVAEVRTVAELRRALGY
jgi:hypothetical protein